MKRKDPAAVRLGRNVGRISDLCLPDGSTILINGKPAAIGDCIRPGDTLTLRPPKHSATIELDLTQAASAFGRKGGKARLKTMTPEQRSAIARKGAAARWKKEKA